MKNIAPKNTYKKIFYLITLILVGLFIGHLAKQTAIALKFYDLKVNYEKIHQQNKSQIVLYGTSTCVYCEQTRAYFKQGRIGFIDLDINKNSIGIADAAAYHIVEVPLVIIGNEQITGFDKDSFQRALAKLDLVR